MTVTRFHLLFLVLLLALAVPFATADTIQLTNNNLGLAGIIGTVNLTQGAGGVNVTLSAGSGFSFKTQGGDILFNTNVNLTASNISQIRINGVAYTGKFSFTKIATRAGFTFVYDLAGLNPKGMQSAGTISFVISGVTVKQLEQGFKKNPYSWGLTSALVMEPSVVRIPDLPPGLRPCRNRARCHCSEPGSHASPVSSAAASLRKFANT